MQFETIFSRFKSGWKPRHSFSEPGNPLQDDFIAERGRFGDVNLTKVGTTNLYDKIQSYADSCDMAVLISRYMQGDYSALNRVQALYGDFSDMPTSYVEASALLDSVIADFATLPAEIKERFDNSAINFMKELGQPGFADKLKIDTVETSADPLEVTTHE